MSSCVSPILAYVGAKGNSSLGEKIAISFKSIDLILFCNTISFLRVRYEPQDHQEHIRVSFNLIEHHN